MPLQVLSRPLGLPDPVVRVAEPGLLFAETCNLLDVTGLLVYRSPMVQDSDPVYENVADLLKRSRVELTARDVIDDPMMYFGQGEWSMYLLHSTQAPVPRDPRVLEVLEIIDTFKVTGPILPTEAGFEFHERLRRLHGSKELTSQ
ncbi:hypothetical protein SEA_SOILDRAGON_77 [Mycobacterium phage SoilDragon]|uniref:Uncharacterized protein n=1 Tax=Mycobacterium phage SoilDragon TaxID=2590944 RepID=A0A516KUK7_9CAUD|nr:hypothetical protein M611_gp21 [Mycobacterium phage Jobu08]YP_010060118.1 hypothetical protein KIJ58_gp23 [Mycobacterium phage SoilDragon]AGM61593.1 hypothetical protein PBI_JOBU08_74 [Mycobacterium phage Jobu08]QDP45375.1 hypothetical protein SEA_SOILDRAGON_77 [Mycobacterium phage SoilDragon]